ncbi:CwfJ C-terminus 1-domain-containing protein-like protein [Absidia repens]|uniref:CwfJ C-terminus 1-domain-containing protein-like protein n=1 Tax=Absidia repens TaxID=90262 RepID=A0A1X2IE30_9FUNG|nr:CwfJ C-terminus 1-domain-containing protein-like protein [Absidia repens]
MTTAQGLKVAFLSGVHESSINTDESATVAATYYSQADIDTLKATKFPLSAPNGVDVLLTTEWPKGIENASTTPPSAPLTTASSTIAQLALALKPRYHFATSENVFFEREPYKNDTGSQNPQERQVTHVSRFIGLGKALNKDKQRWFYAYNIVPMSKATPDVLNATPSLTTDCPFWELVGGRSNQAGQKRGGAEDNGGFFWGDNQQPNKKRVPDNYICKRCNIPGHFIKDCQEKPAPPPNYVCKICNQPGHFIKDCPEKDQHQQQKPPPDLSSCWFCLANPKIEKHLITSIGTEIYATLAKGPLVSPESSPIPGGGHSLLIAITHYPTFANIPYENMESVTSDLANYKESLRQLFASYGQDTAIYEVCRESFTGLSHAHIQVVPIPKELSSNVETVVRQEAEEHGYALIDQRPQNGSYFAMELPNGQTLVHPIHPKERFNLQFGRIVLSKALGQPDRKDWKMCAQTEDEERQAAKDFKEAFKKFDSNLS